MALDPIDVTLLVVQQFDDLQVPYFIGGSLASALYGVVRTTADCDIIADLQPQHAHPIVQNLGKDFYADEKAFLDATIQLGSFNLIHLESMFMVDVFIHKHRLFEESQFIRRRCEVLSTNPKREAYVATAEDVLLAKLERYRLGNEVSERQWYDILGIIKVQGIRLDLSYLHKWANILGVLDLLEKARSKD